MSSPPDNTSQMLPEDWERIARYVTGEADAGELDATGRWIAMDPRRSATVQVFQESFAAPMSEPDVDVEAALRKVKSRMHETTSPFGDTRAGDVRVRPIKPRRPRMIVATQSPIYLRIAAVALVAVGGALWWRHYQAFQPVPPEIFATSIGERRQLKLRDGTRVLLGPASRLEVSSQSADDERTAVLTGDGYFNVVHDADHPFVVNAGSIRVQDVGTAFSIQTADSGTVRVAVDSGRVAIRALSGDIGSGVLIQAHDRVIASGDKVQVERSSVSPDDVAWTQGRLVFRDAPLIQVGAELYRWYGIRLRVADPSLVKLHLTATFSGEPIDRVLNVIALSLGAQVERQGDVAILRRTAIRP